jgi:putative DNA primase/helicase
MNDKHVGVHGQGRDDESQNTWPSPDHTHRLTELVQSLWESGRAIQGTIAETYLRAQGIDVCPAELRYLSACSVGSGTRQSEHPAIIAALRDDDGLVSLEQTFLSPCGQRLADINHPKRLLGFPVGGLGRWGMTPRRILRLADSFEEAASAMVVGSQGIPVWPVFGCERYGLIDIPADIERIVIYAQPRADATRAITLASLHLTTNGRSLEVEFPPEDESWNAYLQRVRS